MILHDLLRYAYRALAAQRLRSLLTALGVVVGIIAVILLTAIGEGIHRYVVSEFSQFGTNLLGVHPGKNATFGLSGASINAVRPLSLADSDALARLAHVKAVVPNVQGNVQVEFATHQRRCNVFGVGPDLPEVWSIPVAAGRFLPADDQRAARPFAVLGAKLHRELFANTNPLGQRIRIGNDRYRVVGVMQSKGQMLGFDLDDTIFIPVGKALEMFNREGLMEITVLYDTEVSVQQITRSVTQRLIERHGREDFALVTQEQMLTTLDSILGVLTLAVGALGGISLAVGAVGILTIMTIAVSERVAEIGLLRALGAERRQVLRLFLCEATALSGAGGMAGVLIGILLVQALHALAPKLPLDLSWRYIAASLLLSLIIGLLAGVLPAIRAARLDPQEALRGE